MLPSRSRDPSDSPTGTILYGSGAARQPPRRRLTPGEWWGIISVVMNEKIALFAFNGDPTCFIHVLLNAVDLHEKGAEVVVVIEGSATALVRELADKNDPFHTLYEKIKREGLVDCVCRACAHKMGSLEAVQTQNLPLCTELSGHPSMSRYLEKGYTIITF